MLNFRQRLSESKSNYCWEVDIAFMELTDEQIRLLYSMYTRILLIISLTLTINTQYYDWSNVEETVASYQMNGAFTGGVLRVSNGTHTIYNYPFGTISHNDLPFGSPPFTNETIFDLASITKVSATLSCIMHLYEDGKLDVDDLVTKFIPEYGNHGKQNTTLRNLLLHNAGLLPDYPGTLPKTKEEVMKWTYNCTLDYPIATKYVYSDLSFILLGQISERVSKKPLQKYAKQLMENMGMPNTTYLPKLASLLYRIAPTQYSVFRRTLIRGVVHDPTAYLFGGVAGHAGFFSIIQDMETYMQIHINKGLHRNGTRVYKQSTVETFYKRQDGLPYNNRRALGWDTVPIQTYPPCGTLFSMNSFGHTGYTGTSIWADRDKNLIVILLTQRVHPTSLINLHVQARSKITDAIVRTLKLN